MDTTFFTALCIFEVESPPIGQINFPAAFTAACYTSAMKHLATRQNFWIQGPSLWDQWTRALGPVDPRAQGPGTCGQRALGPGTHGPWGPVDPRAQCARAAKISKTHIVSFSTVSARKYTRYSCKLGTLHQRFLNFMVRFCTFPQPTVTLVSWN